ncbi:hypothetical protein LP419_08845 [Massilia sp. H-1]|nr:hypothetical protein LP419_08845 [Massilia sp. H-1]
MAAAGLPVQVRASGQPGASLYLALVQNGIATRVACRMKTAGARCTTILWREWAQPVLLGRDGKADITRTLPLLKAGAAAASLGVSAFVQSEQGEVLQALTLNACSGAL